MLASQASPRPALPALTSARFFAALVVLLHHYKAFIAYPDWLAVIADHGQAGVCFFFILSGFILTYNYQDWFVDGVHPAARATFYRARFARVYPLHAVTLLASTLLLALAWQGFAKVPAVPPGSNLVIVSWLAHLSLLQAWLPLQPVQNIWNSPAWSISAEMLFYLVLPYLIAPVTRLARGSAASLCVCFALCLAEGVACITSVALWNGAVQRWPELAPWNTTHWLVSAWVPLRAAEFVIGCCLGALFLAKQRIPAPPSLRLDLVLLLALSGVYGLCWLPAGSQTLDILRHHVLFIPGFALIIYCLARPSRLFGSLLGQPFAILLGEASYALYMIHFLGLVLLAHYIPPRSQAEALGMLGLTILASIACFKWIETPARRWLRGR